MTPMTNKLIWTTTTILIMMMILFLLAPLVGGDPLCNRMDFRLLRGDPSSPVLVGADHTINNMTLPGTEICQGLVATQNMTPPGAEICFGEVVPQHLIPSNISKSTQLMLDQFDNNYRLFSAKA